ncbi:MAG TPA: hypothetical protein VMS93_04635 [Candidatus Saccharimonadales bacterium]|nr:hypothetical protein [Candidatus Saccharimonadales bacterium]
MSSIGSVGTSTSDYLAATATSVTSATSTPHHHHHHRAQALGAGQGTTPPAGGLASMPAELKSELADLVGGEDKLSALDDKISSAVSDALKNVPAGTDARQAIRDAVDQTLQANGVDPTKFRETIESFMAKARGYDPSGAPTSIAATPASLSLPALPANTAKLDGS